MKWIAIAVALLCLLSTIGVAQTHVFGALDTNNPWTGINTFSNNVVLPLLTDGCLKLTGGVVGSTGLACGAGAGTVTSVTFTGDGTVLSSTPTSPVTTTGTLTATLANAPAGMALNNMSNVSAQPSWTNSVVLGLNGGGGYTGEITLEGLTGEISISVPNAAGASHTLLLPVDTGSSGQCLQTNGANPAQLTWASCAGGTGTVTSVGLSINSGSSSGIFAVTGSPVTGSGTLNYNLTGTSGAIPYFSSSSVLSSSGALTAHGVVTGGGAATSPGSTSAGAADTIFMGNDAGAGSDPAFKAGPSGGTNGCAGATDAPTYNTTTHAWGCHQITASGTVNVNGSSVSNPNFNATTPAAAANSINVNWQVSGSDVSGQITGSGSATDCLLGTGIFGACPGGGASTQYIYLPNCSPTGTTVNKLVKWSTGYSTGSANACVSITATADSSVGVGVPVIGICTAGCGTTGLAKIAISGPASCQLDGYTGGVNQGSIVVLSDTVAGACRSIGFQDTPFNENPDAHFIIGLADAAALASSVATVDLVPNTSLSWAAQVGANQVAPYLTALGSVAGSPFTQPIDLQQNNSSASSGNVLITYDPLHFQKSSGYVSIGPSSLGTSGNDMLIDLNNAFPGTLPISMLRMNGGQYFVPNLAAHCSNGNGSVPCNVTGAIAVAQNSAFHMGGSSGVFQWLLTGNVTFNTIDDDDAGHVVTMEFVQASTGGPYTVTWPANFVNPPIMCTVASCTITAQFYYDGTNYNCVSGCAIPATPLATPGTTITLNAPRGYAICTSTCTVTLPTPAAGYEFCVLNDDNVATVITMAGITGVMWESTARTSYGTAGHTFTSGGAAGDKLCVVGRDSTHYLTASFQGTWTLTP